MCASLLTNTKVFVHSFRMTLFFFYPNRIRVTILISVLKCFSPRVYYLINASNLLYILHCPSDDIGRQRVFWNLHHGTIWEAYISVVRQWNDLYNICLLMKFTGEQFQNISKFSETKTKSIWLFSWVYACVNDADALTNFTYTVYVKI